MNYNELEDKLKQLKNEDIIWLIYIGIIFLYIAIKDEEIDVELAFN